MCVMSDRRNYRDGPRVFATREIGALLSKFRHDQTGAVAIIFAFVVILLVGVVGGAVDYGRWVAAKSTQQSAIDAAALAAGRAYQVSGGNSSTAINTGNQHYALLKSHLIGPDATSFQIIDSGRAVRATSQAAVVTPFLGVVGIPEMPVNIVSEAVMAATGGNATNVEISLMLDVTGSMWGAKIADLKLAAKDLIDIVMPSNQGEFYSRVAIAPFSEYVNVGRNYFERIVGEAPSGSNNDRTCVRERQTSDRYTDATPASGNYFDDGDPSGNCRPQSTIMPLSSDKDGLKSHINGLGAAGYTAGHLGTAWAWYLLSPKWNTVWAGDATAAAYNDNVRKIAVLMTDGEYNREYSGASSRDQARQICANMKAAGITVYTVGFQISSSGDAYQTMAQCASSPQNFFNSTTGEELRQAFREIALQVVTLRLSR